MNYIKGHLDNLLFYLWNEVAAYISETVRESVESARPVQNGLVWIRTPPRGALRPVWRQSNDVLDVPCVGSSVESKSDNKNDDTDHFEVGSGDEGHEHHADGRHKERQGSVHLDQDGSVHYPGGDKRPFACSASKACPWQWVSLRWLPLQKRRLRKREAALHRCTCWQEQWRYYGNCGIAELRRT